MKEIFKSVALSAALRAGPFKDFYEGLLANGMEPELARVTLARRSPPLLSRFGRTESISTEDM